MFRDKGGFKPDPRREVNESVDYSAHPNIVFGSIKVHFEITTMGVLSCLVACYELVSTSNGKW